MAASPHQTVNALDLAQALIRRPSVTPDDAGALDVLQQALEGLGFRCRRLPFGGDGSPTIDNLYARYGTGAPNFCFAGHTDVVPVGDGQAWTADPFAGTVRDGRLIGRGASDMKGAIAAFVAAVAEHLKARGGAVPGSISLVITGDEEWPALHGTRKVLDWMRDSGETIDHCLVGEPTNPSELGDMVKIGRRGSLNATVTVHGTQGHVAYPHLADNPVPKLVQLLAQLLAHPLDEGTEHFQPSRLEITSIDVGNPATNVIPATASARFNIRFNPLHSADSLERWLRDTTDAVMAETNGRAELDLHVTGEAFLTKPGDFTTLVADAVETVTGRRPELSTSGGTSDARFIKDVCPVAEFGLLSETMHKVDESVPVDALDTLARIYARILDGYFRP